MQVAFDGLISDLTFEQGLLQLAELLIWDLCHRHKLKKLSRKVKVKTNHEATLHNARAHPSFYKTRQDNFITFSTDNTIKHLEPQVAKASRDGPGGRKSCMKQLGVFLSPSPKSKLGPQMRTMRTLL